jgi:hypothetical protein
MSLTPGGFLQEALNSKSIHYNQPQARPNKTSRNFGPSPSQSAVHWQNRRITARPGTAFAPPYLAVERHFAEDAD